MDALANIHSSLEHFRANSDDKRISVSASTAQTLLAVLLSKKELTGDRALVIARLVKEMDFLQSMHGMNPHNIEAVLKDAEAAEAAALLMLS